MTTHITGGAFLYENIISDNKTTISGGNDLVLVSIIASSGSTPRGAGSHMLIGQDGRVAGTIGGGSVEYRAGLMALDFLKKGIL